MKATEELELMMDDNQLYADNGKQDLLQEGK